jgi:Fic family protein
MEAPNAIFRLPSSMEPMLPTTGRGLLAELSAEIFRKSGELKSSLPSVTARAELAKLVGEMNSYYSNLIEGHKTLPREIARALKEDFSGKPADRRNQRLSVAHIKAERAMRERLASDSLPEIFSAEFIQWLHGEFYSHIPMEEWTTSTTSGKAYPLVPGELRTYNVDVGRHAPPDHSSLDKFLTRFETFYSSRDILATDRLIAAAAAHHRLAWIHPFGDGNGRVARLQSQAALIAAGVDSGGLWTLSRGLAREQQTYYRTLQDADQRRMNDYDGRGNLSDKALSAFCEFFLRQVLDQIEFVIGLIEPETLVTRIGRYFQFERTDLEPKLRDHMSRLVGTLCIRNEVGRGETESILGLKGTATRKVIRETLKEGLIQSPSEKGPLRIAFPIEKVTDFYFPRLFTDLPVSPS